MSDIKVFKMKKTVPGDVLIIVHPLSNPQVSRTVYLTDRNPFQVLPLDYALGIFVDSGNYNMYKEGYFTFENNEELVKAAYENGAYFDEMLDFKPAKEDNEKVILTVLKSGNRMSIDNAVKEHGRETVLNVAIAHVGELTTNVVAMLENLFKVQLTMDGGDISNN